MSDKEDTERRVVVPPQGGKLYPYAKGQSGNPGGNPKGVKGHRAKMRKLADKIAAAIEAMLPVDDDDNARGLGMSEAIALKSLMEAMGQAADRGGYIAVDKLLSLEASVWRTAIAATAAEHLTDDHRDKIIDGLTAKKNALLGEGDEEAASE